MSISVFLLIISTLLHLLLAFFVIKRDHKNPINKSFAFFAISIAFWAISNALFQLVATLQASYFWAIVAYFAGLMLIDSIYFFTYFFPFAQSFTIKPKIMLLIPNLILTLVLIYPKSVATEVIIKNGVRTINTTPVIVLVFLTYIFLLCCAFFFMFRNYKKLKDKNDSISLQQFRIVVYTLVFAIFWGIVTNIMLPAFGNYNLVSFGPVVTLALLIIIAYAIRKFQFLDMVYILNHLLLILLSSVLVFSIFYIVAFTYYKLFGGIFNVGSYVLGTFVSIAFVVYYPKLRNTLQFVIDEELFKAEYDREAIANSVLKRLGEELNITVIQNIVLQTLTQSGITKGGGFRIYREGENISNAISKQYEYKELDKVAGIEAELLEFLQRYQDIIVKEEIETTIDDSSTRPGSKQDILKILNYMKDAGVSIIIPLKGKDSMVGILALREKYSESPFTVQDIEFFDQISIQISVAVQRALLYKESQDFAATLQHKVDEATAELKKAYDELKKVDAEKDDFISIAGHELRTPAAIIKMSLWLVKSYKEIKTAKSLKKIDDALDANERLIKLIDDLLTTSRIDRSKFKIEPTKFDLIELVSKSIEENVHLLGTKKLSVGMTKETQKMKLEIEADRDKMIEVITNLISNSIKYTEKGSIMVRVQKVGKFAEISVKDTGVGISPEQMDKLFKKFSRLDHSFKQTAKIRGTGLGLYITKKILLQHHGDIRAESDGIGKGSTFIVKIPIVFEGELEMKEENDNQQNTDDSSESTVETLDPQEAVAKLTGELETE